MIRLTFERIPGLPGADVLRCRIGPIGLALAHSCVNAGLKRPDARIGDYWPEEAKERPWQGRANSIPPITCPSRGLLAAHWAGNSYQWGGALRAFARSISGAPLDRKFGLADQCGDRDAVVCRCGGLPALAGMTHRHAPVAHKWPRAQATHLESWVANPNIAQSTMTG